MLPFVDFDPIELGWQDALTAACAGNGTLLIPDEVTEIPYRLTGTVGDYLEIRGVSRLTSWIKRPDHFTEANHDKMITLSTEAGKSSEIVLSDFSIDGNRRGQLSPPDVESFDWQHCHGLYIIPSDNSGVTVSAFDVGNRDGIGGGVSLGGGENESFDAIVVDGLYGYGREGTRYDFEITGSYNSLDAKNIDCDSFGIETNGIFEPDALATTIDNIRTKKEFKLYAKGADEKNPPLMLTNWVHDGNDLVYIGSYNAVINYYDIALSSHLELTYGDWLFESQGRIHFRHDYTPKDLADKGINWNGAKPAKSLTLSGCELTSDPRNDLTEFFYDNNDSGSTTKVVFNHVSFSSDIVLSAYIRSGDFEFNFCKHSCKSTPIVQGYRDKEGVSNRVSLLGNVTASQPLFSDGGGDVLLFTEENTLYKGAEMPDFTIGVEFTGSTADNVSVVSGAGYSNDRNNIYTAVANDVVTEFGVYGRDNSAGNVKFQLYEINPTTFVPGNSVAGSFALTAHPSINTYEVVTVTGLSIPLVAGVSYIVGVEHEGTTPRIVEYDPSGFATANERPIRDDAGIQDGVALTEDGRIDNHVAIWANGINISAGDGILSPILTPILSPILGNILN